MLSARLYCGVKAFLVVILAEDAILEITAAEAGRLAAGRQGDFDVNHIAFTATGGDEGIDKHQAVAGRIKQTFNVFHLLRAQLLLEHGAVLARGRMSRPIQPGDQADAAYRDFLGIGDLGNLADGANFQVFVPFRLFRGLRPCLRIDASRQAQHQDPKHPDPPIHGLPPKKRAISPTRWVRRRSASRSEDKRWRAGDKK